MELGELSEPRMSKYARYAYMLLTNTFRASLVVIPWVIPGRLIMDYCLMWNNVYLEVSCFTQ